MDTTHDPDDSRYTTVHGGVQMPNTHDPLCRSRMFTPDFCPRCRFIAQVRADERKKWEPMVQALTDELLSKPPEMSMGAQYLAGERAGRKAAAERVLGALDTERIKWQYRVDTSDGEESMIGRRYVDYVETMERAIELAAAALGEGE